eukprot:TRINITY_DN10008_c0_g1_i1.p1 TRINITY_DN10008_c0_g1~~TRINITY_DN10008_c0_g1_i1.p1  ORF type:complete len:203 (+),score=59.29 TRINITY_DN10008_c0_g1_i1:43-651(+)
MDNSSENTIDSPIQNQYAAESVPSNVSESNDSIRAEKEATNIGNDSVGDQQNHDDAFDDFDTIERDEYALLLNKGLIQSIQPQLDTLEQQLTSVSESQKKMIEAVRLDRQELFMNVEDLRDAFSVFQMTTEYVDKIHAMQERMRHVAEKVEKLQRRTDVLRHKKQDFDAEEAMKRQKEQEREQSLNAKVAATVNPASSTQRS